MHFYLCYFVFLYIIKILGAAYFFTILWLVIELFVSLNIHGLESINRTRKNRIHMNYLFIIYYYYNSN